jgi:hypothetical protein
MPRPNKPANGSSDLPKPARASKKGNGTPDGAVEPFNSPEEVARRAYEIYQRRGGYHGGDLDDWLAAERELRPGPSDVTGPVPQPKPRRRKGSEETA